MRSDKLSSVGEIKAIERLLKQYKAFYRKDFCFPIDDDVQAFYNCKISIKIDGYCEKYSRYPWERWSNWGWRAITGTVSDLYAKGYTPFGVVYSLGLPKNFPLSKLEDISIGIKKAMREYDLSFLGGDLNVSYKYAWIDVAALGTHSTSYIFPRSGAKAGDLVFTTLVNGYGTSSLLFFAYKNRLWNKLPREFLNYTPRAVKEFPLVSKAIKVNSSIDSSDGLAKSLWILAKSSNVVIHIDNIPIHGKVISYLKNFNLNIEEFALYGGEEYEVIFTTSEKEDRVIRVCKSAGIECIKIGKVIEKSDKPKIIFNNREIKPEGWDQFLST
ncbi:thiamine-monophosphate kinase [Fervidicoccus fontis]|jgi:thiamine-monophosphate kinase|uniref:Thiamine-monophosphate kinase n=2 Tax=Fervidicoccus fontis TaxID=683846 RepID=I0A1U4_FERFK|nr:thiamine-phosphate kinase [Fervidicoccus fontis]AFH42951.1 putative thiamine-monophosphate kinase [Fervidicoccus fontis Kam940]MBE9391493.1 thiamine-monophosphate kinase [Fervidicoccus fontis]PMB77160.1 MAG: thiamine-phosphate kinase [Fervidicoccus fontis]HEW63489.1 thiamine-monophosphate kinase [Fervidicoccus fontis]